MFLYILAILVIVLTWDYFHKKRRNEVLIKSGIKTTMALPIIGNAVDLLMYHPEALFDYIRDQNKLHGKCFRIWILHEAFLFTSDPEDIEAILSSPKTISKLKYYNFLNSWLGNGLLLSTGTKWHSRRKIITPAFHFTILEQFVEVFEQQGDVLVKRLKEKADGKTVIDIFPMVCLATLDIILETAMGVKVEAQKHPDFEYAQAVKFMAETVPMRFMRINRQFDWLYNLTAHSHYQKMLKVIAIMHDFTDNVINQRREKLQQELLNSNDNKGDKNELSEIGIKKRQAFLDVLLQSTIDGKPLSNQDIREEVDTFMFEGHDTTTSGISHTCYLIARHPAVQQKLVEEIRQVIGEDPKTTVTMRHLQDLKYLECVIKESLRLYPSVPIIGRQISHDFEMNGKIVPANTNVALVLFHAMRDPDYFPEPLKFMPERFEGQNVQDIKNFAHVPFSAGPRNCVGQKYALLEMKSTISKLLRHYEFLPLGAEVRPIMNIILRSGTGINLGLRPRVW